MQALIRYKLDQISNEGPMLYSDRVLSDVDCPGLRFVGSNDGAGGHWVRRFKDKAGKMKQYAFAQYPETELIDARKYVESVRGQDNPVKLLFSEPTMGMLIDRYLTEYISTQRSPRAVTTVRSALVKNLKPITAQTLDKVTAAILHELILTTKKRAPTMAQMMRSELKQAWSYGLAIGMTTVPCPITTLTGGRFKPFVRDRILTDAELPLLINSMDIYSQTLAEVIIICLYTGLRSGEVIAMHSAEFETDDNDVMWLTIPRSRMKNDLAHRVPFFSKAKTAVIKRICDQGNGFIFPAKKHPSKPMQQVELAREVYRVDGKVNDWHLHDLRRTTRTNLQRIGCPFEISETILAHKLPGVSSVYARYQYNDEKIKWLTELANYYDKVTTTTQETLK